MPVNNIEYAWEDITVTAMGRAFERILEVEYDVEAEKKQIYGRGKKVKGIQNGNEKPTGTLTLGQSELEALIAQAQKTNRLAKVTDISFDIQVHYLNATGQLVKDRILGATFTKQPKMLKQGDVDMQVKLPFLATDILYNMA